MAPTTTPLSTKTDGCRFCGAPLQQTVVDLGLSPLCQNRVTHEQIEQPEIFYPLKAVVCESCWLVQVHAHVAGEAIFCDYAYFSSYSESWLRHCREYVEMIAAKLSLGSKSQVIEIASNDGYLLQYFVEKGIPALGIEPAANVAEAARQKGVESITKFFGTKTACELVDQGVRPDLLLGNNVLAHVPDLNDFVAGLKILLKEDGVITFEFPHLMRLIEGNQFDTIYQEHYCYFSLLAIQKVFQHHGLTIFDVETLSTHGGSLRIYARHSEDQSKPIAKSVGQLHDLEIEKGYTRLKTYTDFAEQVVETKRKLLKFLIQAKREGKTIVGYGAPGKGNTLLNFCGIRTDFLDYTVDRNPMKQNTFLPGSRIPVYAPEKIAETRPDYVLILPWNLKKEIMDQLAYIREWGGQFVVPIPETQVF
ncbi:MAG: class I SAM-dependent methyltransferase [Planctomycetes bacterium]|nr:class I SAM-dependent methyltransferase [Planctomycetota bacterium]